MRSGGTPVAADRPHVTIADRLVPAVPAAAASFVLECRFGRPRRAQRPAAGLRESAEAGGSAPWSTDARQFALAPFQAEGVARLCVALRTWGGAVLADDVGLGKTYTALGVVRRALLAGRAVVLVVPSAVRPHWLARLDTLRRTMTTGSRVTAPIRVVTHGQLSRGREIDPAPGNAAPHQPGSAGNRLVVVDEAHAFRNPATRRYRGLAAICRGSQVLLVTATPVNNSLRDLYFLIRLWAGDGAFAGLGVPDLRALFRRLADPETAPRAPPAAFRRLLAEIVVQRSRSVVATGFPARRAPAVVAYSLGDEYRDGLRQALDTVAALRLPWFAVSTRAVAGEAGAAPLLRLTLLKRLESSAAAFRLSLDRLQRYNRLALEALESGTLLLPAAARGRDAADTDQLLLPLLAGSAPPPWLEVAAVCRAAQADDAALSRLLRCVLPRQVDGTPGRRDPKLDALVRLLECVDTGPTLVFTAFRDTAEYLAAHLRSRHRVALLHGSGGRIGGHTVPRGAVIRRFAPRSNGCRPPPVAERIDVLVATDALSEGLNLQDAGCIISYDLPWNPVRLVQRVGRIDRLGSPHAVIAIHNFVPDADLDALLGLAARLGAKLDAIRLVAGDSAAASVALDASGAVSDHPRTGREPAPVCASSEAHAGERDDVVERGAATLIRSLAAGDEALRALWHRLGSASSSPPPGTRHAPAPLHARLERHPGDPWMLAIFGRRAAQSAVAATADAGVRRLEPARLAALLERALPYTDAPPPSGAPPAWLLTALRQARRIAHGGERADRAQPVQPGRCERALARRLLAALAAEPGGVSPATAARADALLARLRQGVTMGEEMSLRHLLRASAPGPASADAFIDAVLERVARVPDLERRTRRRRSRLIAVFEFTDEAPANAAGRGAARTAQADPLSG